MYTVILRCKGIPAPSFPSVGCSHYTLVSEQFLWLIDMVSFWTPTNLITKECRRGPFYFLWWKEIPGCILAADSHVTQARHFTKMQSNGLFFWIYIIYFAISDSMQLFCLHARLGMHEWFIKPKCHAPWPCFPFVYQFTTLDNAATTSRRDFSRSVKCDEYVFTMHVKNTRARCMRMRFDYILHKSVHPRPFGTCSSLWRMVVSCLHLSHCPLPSSSRKFWSPHTEAPTLVIFMALLMRMACNGSKVALPNQYCKLLICV